MSICVHLWLNISSRIGAHQQRPKNLREALQRVARAPFEYLTTRVRQHRQFRDLSASPSHQSSVSSLPAPLVAA